VTRRTITLLVSAAFIVVLAGLVFFMPVPYVVLSPGPTLNTLGTDNNGNDIIVIKGGKTKTVSGHLNLTTVEVESDNITPARAIAGWWEHDTVVVPRSAIFPPGQTTNDIERQNTEDFTESQDYAVEAAACELGYPRGIGVASVTAGSGAEKHLQPGDQLRSIDGAQVSSLDAVLTILKTKKQGQSVVVHVVRTGKETDVSVVLGAPADKDGAPRLGIKVQDGCLMPFQVDIGLGNEIGGPSAGLMFALGILEKVGPQDLTHGAYIAGTGEIDGNGKVGPIGGIALKMIAARQAGATTFLAPADNCPDVRNNTPSGLNVVKVANLHGAVTALADLAQGKAVPHC